MTTLETTPTLKKTAVDTRILLDSIATEMRYTDPSGPPITTNYQKSLPLVQGDAYYLQTALHHILENAYRLTPPDGCIEIRTRMEDDQLIVEVEDTGPGIPTDHLDKVFETFWRQDQTARATPGFGLGLSIARKIVELHNGQITVNSEVGGGSLFRVTIPTDT